MAADIVTGIPSYALTQQRPPPVGLDKELPSPGLPRANKAISRENQKGSPAHLARPDLTVIQQVGLQNLLQAVHPPSCFHFADTVPLPRMHAIASLRLRQPLAALRLL